MAHYGPPVFGYIVRCGVDPAIRDDVFQDVFFKIHRNAPLYSANFPLRPWLFTVAANVVRSHYRKRSVFQRFFASKEPSGDEPSKESTLEEISEGRETASRLDRAIQNLPMKQREVLSLVCFEGMATDEVGVALGMPVNTVKTNLQRARRAIRKELERHKTIEERETQ